jgi:hypothetical protein
MPNVQAVGRGVEADVEPHGLVARKQLLHLLEIRALGDQIALFQFLKYVH